MLTGIGIAECKESKQCAPSKHHFEECVERVQAAAESEKPSDEDCVEECGLPCFFSTPPPSQVAARLSRRCVMVQQC